MAELLLPLLGSVADKAGNALVGKLLRAWGLDDDRRTLVRHLEAVRGVLRDAEARSSADDVREWANDLKLAAYRADDVLEDFRYEALRREAQIDGSTARVVATSRKVLNYFTPNCPAVFRLSMSRKLKGVLETIDKLVNEKNKFHFLEHNEMPSTVHTHQTHAHVDVSRIVGKEAERDQVVKILFEQQDNSSVTVLPIVGMGGIGKTTLAQLVHNDERVRRHFELSIWVCVSDKKFVLADLIQSIIEVAKNKRCDLSNNLEVLRKELGVVLAKKRYLLVLDDVWTEERRELEGLISLLQSHAGSGSAIVVTSRSHRVAEIMGTTRPYQISLLDDNRSWELFRIKAFGSRGADEQSELTSVAKEFVPKCRGLPLVINTMAALLGSIPDRNDWSSILNSDVWTNAAVKQEVVPVLRLSYDHLSPELKRCFSFCAVFPKDSLLEKDMLIQLWVANSFIAPTEGQRIFKELVWRCFLQVQDEDLTRGGTTCKMHDLMHDLAESIPGNDCLGTESSLRVVRHLSVDSAETSASMKEILAPRTVLFLERGRCNEISLGMAKSQLMSLRALKAFDVDSIQRHIIYLKHLRYLDLSESEIVALPEATVMLYSLQTLKLTRCHKLKKLPEGMRYMTSLLHVFLTNCYKLERMPAGFSQLNCLGTLTDYIIGSEAGRGIDELKDLNSLGGSLYLSELRNVQSSENAKLGNISSKHHLRRLGLNWLAINTICSRHNNTELEIAEAVLEALRPPSTLQGLTVANYNGAKWSSWMLLAHLSELGLHGCNNCKNLPPLWQLPSLRRLSLEFMESLTSICSGVDTGNGESCISQPTSPKLETVYFRSLPKLERWHEEVAGQEAVVSFPQLKKLHIWECPMLASMPKLPLLEDLEVEKSERVPLTLDLLSTFWCKETIPVESVGSQPLHLRFSGSRLCTSIPVGLEFSGLMENVECIEVELNLIPCTSIKDLHITDCEGLLSSEPSQILRNSFAFVEHLRITRCSNIVQWPAREIRNLNCLRLRSLVLENCQNLTGSFPSTSDDQSVLLPQLERLTIYNCENLLEIPELTASLPQLERLSIKNCGNLLEIPELPASLHTLDVTSCPNLVSLLTNPGSLPKLSELVVRDCNHLTRFLHGVDGLTALDYLWIVGCPRVETLPEGLLQRLTALKDLYIEGCPDLQRRCSRGGAYWDLVKAIPDLRVEGSESGPRNKCLICL